MGRARRGWNMVRPDQQQLLLEPRPLPPPSPKHLQGGPQCCVLTREAEDRDWAARTRPSNGHRFPSQAGLGLLNRNCQGPAFPITDSIVIVSKQSSEPPTKHVSDLGARILPTFENGFKRNSMRVGCPTPCLLKSIRRMRTRHTAARTMIGTGSMSSNGTVCLHQEGAAGTTLWM